MTVAEWNEVLSLVAPIVGILLAALLIGITDK